MHRGLFSDFYSDAMPSRNQSRYPGFNGEQYYSPYQFPNSPFPFGPSHPSDMGYPNPPVPVAKKSNAQKKPKTSVAIPVFDATDSMQNENKEPDKRQHGFQNNKPQGKKTKIVSMSREEAADRIWAAYQGYKVRRTRPLQQLRLIKNVRSRLNEIKSSASDPNCINKAREDSRERLRLTEGIMSLLLQLDALQGVHPFVREIRKGLTREIVQLQENIDAMLQGAELKQVQEIMASEEVNLGESPSEEEQMATCIEESTSIQDGQSRDESIFVKDVTVCDAIPRGCVEGDGETDEKPFEGIQQHGHHGTEELKERCGVEDVEDQIVIAVDNMTIEAPAKVQKDQDVVCMETVAAESQQGPIREEDQTMRAVDHRMIGATTALQQDEDIVESEQGPSSDGHLTFDRNNVACKFLQERLPQEDEVPMAVTIDVESSKDAAQHNEVQPEEEKVLSEVPVASSSSMMHEYRDVMKQLLEDNHNMKMLLQQYMEKSDWQNFMIVDLSERMANLEKILSGKKHTKKCSTCTTGKKHGKHEKDEGAKSPKGSYKDGWE